MVWLLSPDWILLLRHKLMLHMLCVSSAPSVPSPTLPLAEEVHVMAADGFVPAAAWWHRPGEAWGEGERLLAAGAAAVADLRAAVAAELGYTCSAGVAHTKLMAKLCSG